MISNEALDIVKKKWYELNVIQGDTFPKMCKMWFTLWMEIPHRFSRRCAIIRICINFTLICVKLHFPHLKMGFQVWIENKEFPQVWISSRNWLLSVLIFHSWTSMIALSKKIFCTMLEEINLCVIIRYHDLLRQYKL